MHDTLDPASPEPSTREAARPLGGQFRVVATEGSVVAVAGEIDEGVVDAFRAALQQRDVTAVDMARVTFLNSSGLRVLIEVRGERGDDGDRLELRNPSRQVRRVLEITGLMDWIAQDRDGDAPPS